MQNASTSTPQTGVKLRGAEKTARIPVKIIPITPAQQLRKPEWIRADGAFVLPCRSAGAGRHRGVRR